jgi:hypothetical protein
VRGRLLRIRRWPLALDDKSSVCLRRCTSRNRQWRNFRELDGRGIVSILHSVCEGDTPEELLAVGLWHKNNSLWPVRVRQNERLACSEMQ